MMFLFTTIFLEKDFVRFKQHVVLSQQKYCLSFYFRGQTTAVFQVISHS